MAYQAGDRAEQATCLLVLVRGEKDVGVVWRQGEDPAVRPRIQYGSGAYVFLPPKSWPPLAPQQANERAGHKF